MPNKFEHAIYYMHAVNLIIILYVLNLPYVCSLFIYKELITINILLLNFLYSNVIIDIDTTPIDPEPK